MNKLGFDIPRRRKDKGERNIDFFKSLTKPKNVTDFVWNRIKSFWNQLEEYDSDEGNFKQVQERVFADNEGNQLTSVPIKFTGNLIPEDVSLNIPKSVLQYYYSAQMNKKLVENLPIPQALIRQLENPENKPLDLSKTIIGKIANSANLLLSPKQKDSSIMADVSKKMFMRYWGGQEKSYLLGDNKFGRVLDRGMQVS